LVLTDFQNIFGLIFRKSLQLLFLFSKNDLHELSLDNLQLRVLDSSDQNQA